MEVYVQRLVSTLKDWEAEYISISTTYQDVEHIWRNRSFGIALALGAFPLVSTLVSLMPNDAGRWLQVAVSFCQVAIVVANLKLEVGERIFDAAVARKGYAKLAAEVEEFIRHVHLTKDFDVERLDQQKTFLMIQLKALTDQINAMMTYPEKILRLDKMAEKRRASAMKFDKSCMKIDSQVTHGNNMNQTPFVVDYKASFPVCLPQEPAGRVIGTSASDVNDVAPEGDAFPEVRLNESTKKYRKSRSKHTSADELVSVPRVEDGEVQEPTLLSPALTEVPTPSLISSPAHTNSRLSGNHGSLSGNAVRKSPSASRPRGKP